MNSGNKLRSIPNFRKEDEERDFWATHDSTEYIDWSKARRVVMPNLKPTAMKADPRKKSGTSFLKETSE